MLYKRICDNCEKTSDAQLPHMPHMTPRYDGQVQGRAFVAIQVLPCAYLMFEQAAVAMGSGTAAGQELMSITGSTERAVFDTPWIRAALQNKTAPFVFDEHDKRDIYLSIDPNGAHRPRVNIEEETLSAMALVSCVYSEVGQIRHQHIIAIDAYPVESRLQIQQFLGAHITVLRSMPNFTNRRTPRYCRGYARLRTALLSVTSCTHYTRRHSLCRRQRTVAWAW